MNCPGHCGHIDLDVPVYNPLMFPAMFLLLRSKCLYCHKFRMDAVKVRQYLVKLKLLELGNIVEFTNFDDFLVPPQVMMSLTVRALGVCLYFATVLDLLSCACHLSDVVVSSLLGCSGWLVALLHQHV